MDHRWITAREERALDREVLARARLRKWRGRAGNRRLPAQEYHARKQRVARERRERRMYWSPE